MLLSEIKGLNYLKDGYFENFGKLGRIHFDNTISFITSENYLKYVDEKITCIVCNKELVKNFIDKEIGIVISDNPKSTFYEIYYHLYINGYFKYEENKISEKAYISPRAIIAKSGVIIGDNCVIEDNVVIREGTILEENVIVRNNSIVAGEGFEVANVFGINRIIPHTGYCLIKKNTEILNNVVICKGLFRGYDTIIYENVKIDNFTQVAHGVKIGKNSKIAGGTVISGNTEIGENVWIGPNATISNGLKIGNNAYISLGSVVVNDLKDGEKVSGNFAYEHGKFIKDFMSKKIK
ncbi:MAG: DapH/DapD/GlmU-related protein [Fervidobacterium sp.]